MKNQNRRKKLIALFSVLFIFLIGVYLCGIFIPESAVTGSFANASLAPSFNHPFGTDALGRDLLLRTVKGLSVSITVGAVASVVSAVIAIIAGLAAASGRRWADEAISWVTDLFMSVPHTILIILISFALGRGLFGLLVGISATHWCALARLVRAEVISLRSEHYIAVSRKLGKSGFHILLNHILPHIIPQVIVGMVLMFPHAILHEAAISFLGFGLPPEQSAIGIILSESMRYLSVGMWWPAVLPGATLVLVVLIADRLGEYLRAIIDPYSAQD